MDWLRLALGLFILILGGALGLIYRSITSSSRPSPTPRPPAWLNALHGGAAFATWTLALTFGMVCYCSSRRTVDQHILRPILFSAALCANMTKLSHVIYLEHVYDLRIRWSIAAAGALCLGATSIALSVQRPPYISQEVIQYAPPAFVTATELAIAAMAVKRLLQQWPYLKQCAMAASYAFRLLDVIPLWAWTAAWPQANTPTIVAVQLIYLGLLVWPQRYWPLTCIIRWRLRRQCRSSGNRSREHLATSEAEIGTEGCPRLGDVGSMDYLEEIVVK